jgi:hypothetical protein
LLGEVVEQTPSLTQELLEVAVVVQVGIVLPYTEKLLVGAR